MRNSSGNGNKGGDVFREWLSDHLRYFILLIVLLLAIMAISVFSRLLDQNMNRNSRNVGDPGSASAVKSEKETEEAIVILSSEATAPAEEQPAEPEEQAAAVKETEAVTEKQTEAVTEKQTEAVTEKQTEAVTEKQTEAVTEKQTEAVTEKQTEAVTEKQTETATEKQTEAVTEKVTEAATEKQTEAVTEKQTEAVTEKQTEAVTEKQTEAVTEKQTEAVTEKQTEAATKKQTGAAAGKVTEAPVEETVKEPEEEKKSEISASAEEKKPEVSEEEKEPEVSEEEKPEADENEDSEESSGTLFGKIGKMTTSSTEKTVHASANSKKPVTAATLAGVGAEEQETETESHVTTGSVTVSGLRNTTRTPVLVSGGSSTSGNRASITNIDTGNTIGTYRRVGDTGTQTTSVPAADADHSGGLIESAGSTQTGEGAWDAGQQEVASVAEPAPQPEYRTISSACNLRSYPDYGDNVIGTLQAGEQVLFYGLEEGWYKVEYYGTVGYIGPKFLQ